MPFVSNNSKLLFLPLLLWVLLKEKTKAWRLLAVSALALAFADSAGNLLKQLIARPRPFSVIGDVHLLVGAGNSFSMPSNHATNAFAIAMAFWLMRKDAVTRFFIFVAAVIGLSRIFVGVHYPSDVLAGGLLGTAAAYAAVRLSSRASEISRKGDYRQALFIVLLLCSIFRIYYILTGPFDLSPDEAHYWEWSRRLDLSYYSKGPMIAYLISAGTAIFGNTVLGVRVFAVLLSALSSLILYKLGKSLYDERTGFVAALLVQVVPLYSVFGMLLTIDSPYIFFWILSLFFFWKAIGNKSEEAEFQNNGRRSNKNTALMYWILLGLSIGLGLLTKYTMALFYLSGLLFFVFHKDSRRHLVSKGPYLALLTSLAVFSPVIIWNAAHGWVTLKHTAGQAHLADGFTLSPKLFFEFLGSQLGIVTPVLFVLICIALWKLKKGREGAFLFWFSVPMVVFFLLKSVQGKVQANWALTAYATGFIAFAAYYGRNISPSRKRMVTLPAFSIILALVLTVFAHFPSLLHLPQKMDPTMKLLGWKELAGDANAIYASLPAQAPAFVFSDSYQLSSELAFYMKGKPRTYCINLGRRMDQYDLWPGFENYKGYNAVFVAYDDRDLPEELRRAFARAEKVPVLIVLKRNKIMKFTVFKCYDFRGLKPRPPETY